jgi:hypothetical protein
MSLRLAEQAGELVVVVGLAGHVGGQDDLLARHHELGVVAPQPALTALHDAAFRVGDEQRIALNCRGLADDNDDLAMPAADADRRETASGQRRQGMIARKVGVGAR